MLFKHGTTKKSTAKNNLIPILTNHLFLSVLSKFYFGFLVWTQFFVRVWSQCPDGVHCFYIMIVATMEIAWKR
jgi:hypothetical protein